MGRGRRADGKGGWQVVCCVPRCSLVGVEALLAGESGVPLRHGDRICILMFFGLCMNDAVLMLTFEHGCLCCRDITLVPLVSVLEGCTKCLIMVCRDMLILIYHAVQLYHNCVCHNGTIIPLL